MKNLGVLSSGSTFLCLASLGEAGQGINTSISFFLAIVDLEVIPEEFLGSTNLPGTQALGIYEWAEIVVVGKDKKFIFQPFK